MVQSDCKYSFKDVKNILEHTTWPDKKKVDTLLQMDCSMYTNLGTDSLRSEKEEVTNKSRKIYEAIQKVDHAMGSSFLILMDKL